MRRTAGTGGVWQLWVALAALAQESVLTVPRAVLAEPPLAAFPALMDDDPARPAPPFDVERLVAAALRSNPLLIAMREHAAAAEHEVRPAAALPDPSIELMLQDVGFPDYTVGDQEMSMVGVELRQELLWPGKRRARRDVAGADAAVRAAEAQRLERRVAAQVRSSSAALYALDQERHTLAAGIELLETLAAVVGARYRTGEGDQAAVVRQRLEVATLRERMADVLADRERVASELNRLIGRPVATPLDEVAALPPVTVPPGDWEAAAVAAAPTIMVRQAEVRAAALRARLAQVDGRPDSFLGLGYAERGKFDSVVTLRFGLELPAWRGAKQRPLQATAAHHHEAAQREFEDARRAAAAAVAVLAARWRRDEEQVARYRDGIIPQARFVVDSALVSYLTGAGAFETVIEDIQTWLTARVGLARREADRYSTWAEITELLGSALPAAGELSVAPDKESEGS